MTNKDVKLSELTEREHELIKENDILRHDNKIAKDKINSLIIECGLRREMLSDIINTILNKG